MECKVSEASMKYNPGFSKKNGIELEGRVVIGLEPVAAD